MIRFENVTKAFRVNGKRRVVIDNLTLTIPTGQSLALLGRNGAGKSTLLQMLAGNMRPDRGRILRDGTISWPVGMAGAIHPHMTGAQNARFIARVYGVDGGDLTRFVEEFAELGAHFHMPVRTYSGGMRGRLNFGLSMGIGFDTYLIDEVTATGDARFREKSVALFRERVTHSDAIMVNHNLAELKAYCQSALLLNRGKLTYFQNLEEAISAHKAQMLRD